MLRTKLAALVCLRLENSQDHFLRQCFLDVIYPHLMALKKGRELILCGDINIAHQQIDLKDMLTQRRMNQKSCAVSFVMEMHGFPVFTKYKKKKREFRVHVFKDAVVAVVEKKRRREFNGERDTKIRNLANGYVFVQGVENEPAGLRELAIKAAAVSPSDFRGVDIGYNEKKNELFVIEVNSAPGIEGSNVNKYVNTIAQYV